VTKQLVYQGSFSVVNMGDDCDVSDFLLVHGDLTAEETKKVRRAALWENNAILWKIL